MTATGVYVFGDNQGVEFAAKVRFHPDLPFRIGPDEALHLQDFLPCLDELIRPEYLPRATRALCNGKTSAFQAEDAGSIPAARSTPLQLVRV